VLNPGDESRVGMKFESWVMHFAHVIKSRNIRTWGVVVALALLVILIVAQNSLKWTTYMACWIKSLPEVGTDHPL
jgi:hypothetical protein